MSQKFFQIFRSQISDLKTDNVDYLKKPPWKKIFFDIFVTPLSNRYEKRSRMLQRLFSLFQSSKNQLWEDMNVKKLVFPSLHIDSWYPKLILVSIVADTLFSTNVIVLWNAKSSDCLLFYKVFKKQNKMWLSSSGISICVPLNR